VFESPVSRLEKDWKKTGKRLDWTRKKTRLQSWSLLLKNQRPEKDRSFRTGLDRLRPVFCTPYLPLQIEPITIQIDEKMTEIFNVLSKASKIG
jgi:hypothetical protein